MVKFISWKDKNGISKIPLAKSKLFWTGLAMKAILSLLFASGYLRDLFAPFANYFIESGFQNPYEHFNSIGSKVDFPYPPLMLWLFSLPRLIFWFIIPGSSQIFTIADSVLYRIPMFLADLAILFVLIRWFKTRTRQVLIWYWLSPVLIYINYFHGQLDVIPIAIVFISLYFLFKSRLHLAFILLGMAIACKTNIALVAPFYFIYLLKNQRGNYKTTIVSILLLLFAVLLINLPYISSSGFIKMVYNNPVQQQVFDLFYQFNKSLKIYFIPAVYFVLVLWYFSFIFVNRDQLILFLLFSFLALTLLVAPMQGWYYWILPLLAYFAIKQGRKEKSVVVLLSVLYFVYFGLVENSDYYDSFNFTSSHVPFVKNLNQNVSSKMLDVVFTLLQTTLGIAGFLVFRKGIASNIQAKFLSQPYMVGIGGDSAAGKSTLSNALRDVFEAHNTNIIRGDDMHKWERGNENWKDFTHLDPKANHLHEELNHAKRLKTGQSISRRFYNHTTGKFTLPTFIKPNKLIIFEGLHSFYLANQAEIYDLKIFMEPEENLRIWWKVNRDVSKRNYTPKQVLDQINSREEDSDKYIKIQKSKADIVASFYSTTPLDPTDVKQQPTLAIKITIEDRINPEPLLDELVNSSNLSVDHSYSEGKQTFTFIGEIEKSQIESIGYRLFPELEEIGVYNPIWKDGYEGILQLITVYVIFSKLKIEHQ